MININSKQQWWANLTKILMYRFRIGFGINTKYRIVSSRIVKLEVGILQKSLLAFDWSTGLCLL